MLFIDKIRCTNALQSTLLRTDRILAQEKENLSRQNHLKILTAFLWVDLEYDFEQYVPSMIAENILGSKKLKLYGI